MTPDVQDFLQTTALFAGATEPVLRDVASEVTPLTLEPDALLFDEGDAADALYFVLEGELQAEKRTADGERTVLGTIAPGGTVGEMQILAGGNRTATVRATRSTRLLRWPKDAFSRFAERHPAVVDQIISVTRQRVRQNQLAAILPVLFGKVEDELVTAIGGQAEWLHLSCGEVLFRQGDPDDTLYLLVSGRLEVSVETEEGAQKVVGEITRGESVGEMNFFSRQQRTATVAALRDSVLVRFTNDAFEHIIARYPQVARNLTQVIIRRHRQTMQGATPKRSITNIALVATGPDVPLPAFARKLAALLAAVAPTLHLSTERVDQMLGTPGIAQTREDDPHRLRLTSALDEHELAHRFVLYEADRPDSAWAQTCVRQADHILLVAAATGAPAPSTAEAALVGGRAAIATSVRRSLVLLHGRDVELPSGTQAWLTPRKLDSHHHVRWEHEADLERLARFLSGRAVGLALGGGGARGMAHIGVVRALREMGVPIDFIGGTSMGAVIATQAAMGWSYERILEVNHFAWNKVRPFREYTLPLIALLRSRRFDYIATHTYGDVHLEDLWINCFCVSTNLTTTESVIHRTGPVWKAVRASSSFPGIAVPVPDGGCILVDGAVLNNLPGDVMRDLCGGPVVVVQVTPETDLRIAQDALPSPWEVLLAGIAPGRERVQVPTIFDVIMRSLTLSSDYRSEAVLKNADFVLRPPVDGFALLEYEALDEIVERGYTYTREQERALREALELLP